MMRADKFDRPLSVAWRGRCMRFTGFGKSVRGTYFRQSHPARGTGRAGASDAARRQWQSGAEHGGEVQS